MLPGFRFLFAALVLSMSILVFGFGAAALLRTAHEEFASTPSWQPAPETRFAQSRETTPPVLAMLRVDDPPKELSKDPAGSKDLTNSKDSAASKDMASERPDAAQPVPNGDPPNAADQAAITPGPTSVPDKVVALQPSNSTPIENAKPEAKTSDSPAAENTPPIETPAATAEVPATTGATHLAAVEPAAAAPSETVSSASIETASTPDPTSVPAAPAADAISTKIATLGGPPVPIETAKPKAAAPKADSRDEKKTRHAKRERRHRRASARVTVQAPQAGNPFGQPATTAAR